MPREARGGPGCPGNGPARSPGLPRPRSHGNPGTGPSRAAASALAGDGGRARPRRPPGDLRAEPHQRVVLAARDALLHGDQRVVGDLDVLRAYLGAALGDVAQPETEVVLSDRTPVGLVGGVHFQLRDPHQEPRAGERLLILRVVADSVAGVLAQEALDALAELLRAVHVLLHHPELAEADRGIR